MDLFVPKTIWSLVACLTAGRHDPNGWVEHLCGVGELGEGAEPLGWINTVIGNAKTFLLGTYHGRPDPKHLQAYLNEYCYRVNRRFGENQLFPRLVAACANCEPITYSELTQ